MKRKPGRPRSKDPRVTLSVRVKKETKRRLSKFAEYTEKSMGGYIDGLMGLP